MSAHRLALKLTVQAERDILDIQLYSIQQWGLERSDAYNAAITNALQLLTENPAIGRERDDLRPGLRCMSVEQHLILYRISRQRIAVQRVIHARQDLRRAFPPRVR